MPDLVIADASCLIVLHKTGQLDLLRALYPGICTTPTVASEFGLPLPHWLPVRAPRQPDRLTADYGDWVTDGELIAITLALETPSSVLILDDKKARQLAQRFSLTLTGTLGVLLRAKRTGLLPALKPLLAAFAEADFRLSDQLVRQVLLAAGEL